MSLPRATTTPVHLALPVLLLVLAAVLVAPPAPVGSTPVCPGEDKTLCSGRTFPEPTESVFALTFAETAAGLRSLADEFPGWLSVEAITTPEGSGSVDGNEILLAELTDPDSTVPMADRKVVFISQSIHGNEPGGREGGVRYLEDLLRGVDGERRALLDRVRLVQVFLNPDGWEAGDHDAVAENDGDSVGLWVRGNGESDLPIGAGDFGNVDLNRNAPWFGYSPGNRPAPNSQPEMQALVEEVRSRLAAGQDIQAATDIHGEVNNTAAWIMLSAGEFDLQGMTQQRQHGEAVVTAVEDVLSDSQLVTLSDMLGQLDGVAILTASSEFGPLGSGGSGTGFTGDWLAQQQGGDSASISTIELFNLGTPGVNSVTFNRELFQIYRDTVAAIMGALLDQAVVDWVPTVDLPGTVGYVVDPATVTEPADVLDPFTGAPRTPQERSTMAFFDDLQPYIGAGALVPLERGALAGALADLSAVIVTADLPDDADVAALRTFAEGGGRVVLTDDALTELGEIVGAALPVEVNLSDINQVDFEDARDHPLLDGIRDIAFLLVEPATLGYNSAGGRDTPAWRVASEPWESAGGETVGTIAGQTGVGRIDVGEGEGEVTIIGQLLPPLRNEPSERILYGLEEYGVLDTGYEILFNALRAEVGLTARDLFPADPDPDGGGGGTTPPPSSGGGSTTPPPDDEATTPPPDQGPAEDDEATDTLLRLAGGDRIATAIAASRDAFDHDGAGSVALARADAFPDALAGGTLATTTAGPLLLTPSDALPETVAAEIDRVLPDGGTVYVLGGQAAIAPAVMASLAVDGYDVVRVGGATRFETAVRIAEVVDPDPSTVLLATGSDFPDALAAGAAAAHAGGVVLLTDGDRMPAETAEHLAGLGDVDLLAVGGQAAAAAPEATALVGADRFATAVLVAERVFPSPAAVGIATGHDFPDALAGGAHIAPRGGPILLARPDGLPSATAGYLTDRAASITRAYLFGGVAALSSVVEQEVGAAIR